MNRCVALLSVLAATLSGCNESKLLQLVPDAAAPIAGLTAEQASRVVAKAGDHAITLAEFARTLERMDQFDRLRYQTKERRRELLNEMVDVELLAAEAKRRGLDKDPEAEDSIRVILRDAMIAKAREGMQNPAQIPMEDVRAYFEANTDKFNEPERRRIAAIVMADKKEAEKVLKEAQKVKSPTEWGELFFKHSLTAPKTHGPNNPADLAGDLGIVGPPEDAKGNNPKVPSEVRAAAFKLGTTGMVAGEVISAEGKYFIVRLNGITAPHHRTLGEAERSIRVLIVQEKMQQRERALEEDLRKKFPVTIDEQALAMVKVPAGMERWYAMDSGMWPSSEEPAPGTISPPADAGAPQGHDGGAATTDGGR